ncbi:hypothetical protein SKAU_G00106350 [Synaphobranchus kaupii]|uniref:Uncharacterized protein n=1 Tax=Synaphobranchus kaupii TaxID=118154 RepID=A0A9Q1J6V8_SYNKA|nr:hypothetical protein SKAU_G00106350 [Synaphobranchus kaupii]
MPCGNVYPVGDSVLLSPVPVPCGTCSCDSAANSMMSFPGSGGSSSRFVRPDYRHPAPGHPRRLGRPARRNPLINHQTRNEIMHREAREILNDGRVLDQPQTTGSLRSLDKTSKRSPTYSPGLTSMACAAIVPAPPSSGPHRRNHAVPADAGSPRPRRRSHALREETALIHLRAPGGWHSRKTGASEDLSGRGLAPCVTSAACGNNATATL